MLVPLLAAASCREDPPRASELIVSIQTDVALPDSIDRLRLEVRNQATSQLLYSRDIEVGAGKQPIPATLGFVPGKDPDAAIVLRLHAQKGSVVKMLREVVTTIPRQRIARLSMPIRWLCDDSAKATGTAPNIAVEHATCTPGQTCIAGECRDSAIDSAKLPDFVEADVFGGGRCFDVPSCMLGATRPVIDVTRCAFPRPTDIARLNVALRVRGDGICDGPDCHVILDRDAVDGWRAVEDRIELPRAVCARLGTKRIEAVVITTDRCEAKYETRPVCGAWTDIVDGASPSPHADAGDGDGAPPPAPPPTEILGVVPRGGTLYSFTSQNPYARGFDIRAVSSSLFYGYQTARTTVIAAISLPPPTPPEEAKPVQLAELNGRFLGPWFDDVGESVFWADSSKVFMSSTKAPGSLPAGGTSHPGFQFYEYVDVARAIDTSSLFGATYDSSAISSFQRGATQGPVIVGSALAKQRAVVMLVDRDPTGFVYLGTTGTSATDRGQIERLPKQSGQGSAFTVASIPKITLTALVRDGGDFYAMGYSVTGSSSLELSGAIYRVPVSGGTPALLIDRLSIPANLIVDGDRMYWTETPRDKPARILRAPKAGRATPDVLFETKNTTGQSTITSMTAGPDRIYFAMVDEGQGKLFYLPK